jgi:hypothetical protein
MHKVNLKDKTCCAISIGYVKNVIQILTDSCVCVHNKLMYQQTRSKILLN